MSSLQIADREFDSRLIVGSGRFPDPETMREALRASGTEMVTVALRRANLNTDEGENVLKYLQDDGYFLLPNTAGCYTAEEAITTAKLGREALGTNWVKLEVIGDDETLFPDVPELLKAAEKLILEDFVVLPYANDDPITCRKLADMGCAAVMPLGAPIGSGMGIRNPYNLRIIKDLVDVPVIVDAGVGTASDAAIAMELGMDAVLMNSAISQAKHPVKMAEAMKKSIEAGRLALESGRMPKRLYAKASSPEEGLIEVDREEQ
ncbi:thiazole-phosphate synthase [Fodinibius salinus]|uniref:Thiazole synthase n=1 Tax=Fodinibius salinus TaxID=860790 RepID=A0A5D3YLV7_9BACT|nr:thiazole synthase [Fodinibius salinus]TYP93906.1 thiazole-phosphate synthase [Fodinibius salinus]